jgi:hypothetical protein
MRTKLALVAALVAFGAWGAAMAPAQARGWDERDEWRRVQRERTQLQNAYEARQRALWRGDYWAARRAEERIERDRHDLARAQRDLRHERWDNRRDRWDWDRDGYRERYSWNGR